MTGGCGAGYSNDGYFKHTEVLWYHKAFDYGQRLNGRQLKCTNRRTYIQRSPLYTQCHLLTTDTEMSGHTDILRSPLNRPYYLLMTETTITLLQDIHLSPWLLYTLLTTHHSDRYSIFTPLSSQYTHLPGNIHEPNLPYLLDRGFPHTAWTAPVIPLCV